ncbi:outer membrane beta-barrel family protein [Daejeonella lutea]|uniref:Outer membrane receptor proteins, mostly Fe transport n=1 Tax=Daejeonella lutea TaxID=572036 RepID=A0A1T5EDG3_9SPHI|nr:outer membrane beta-barrel family protein [Daejeonella lutea]SKB81941.1 Outer membrane receptor proteins, mostly Fe transport [Daejeonella lutea]
MKASSVLLILTTLLTSGPIFLKAQSISRPYIISGFVNDSTNKRPLDFVTISLKDKENVVIKTTLSKADGSFSFDKISPANYSVVLISIGYNSKTISLELKNSDLNLGQISLGSQSYKLSEVKVVADRAIIKQETDRINYDIKADPESKGSTVLEIMRKVPLLSVDGDDNLMMNGNKSYKILINGKPSGMMERNSKDILRSMPASSIKNVEVIFSPSSKYDVEGVAGIINIVTDKKVDNGYNGSINLSERFPLGGPATGGSFTIKHDKLGASFLGGASQYLSPAAENFNVRSTTGLNPTNLIQNSIKKSDVKTAYVGFDISYELDSLNLISGQFNVSRNKLLGDAIQSSLLSNSSGSIQGYTLTNDIHENGSSADAGLNYQLGFRSNKSRLLTLSYRFLEYDNKLLNNLNITDRISYNTPNYIQENDGSSREQTVQIDYVHPFRRINVEGGVKGIFRTNNSAFNYHSYDEIKASYENIPAFSNLYENKQNIFSAYNTYQFNIKTWGFKAGARIENTIVNADFFSTSSSVRQNYLNVIPAVAISKKFKDLSMMSLTFTTRMQRPGITQLNPFVDRSNPEYYNSGNPDLNPAFTNMVYLGYNRSKKTTLSFAAAYMVMNGLVMPVSTYDPVSKVTTARFANINKAKVLRSNVYISQPLSSRMNVTFNTDVRYIWSRTFINGEFVDNSGPMAYLNINTGYRFEKGWRVSTNLTANTRSVGIQENKNGFIGSSFSLNKELIKDKLTLTSLITNPFNKYRNNIDERFGPGFNQKNDARNFYRGFAFSVNYRFGKLKSQIAKNKRTIVNDDSVER